MEPDQDEAWETLIENFRPRLKEYIVVSRVLDHITFIDIEQKERIRQTERTEGNLTAVNLLLAAVLKRPHPDGWFTAFVDALYNSGCELAADYMRNNPPTPEEQASNDTSIRLIQILYPSLIGMNTEEVCRHCYAKKLITKEDSEIITTRVRHTGSQEGARELLSRIVKGRHLWLSEFLEILHVTQHKELYELIRGKPHCDAEDEDLYLNDGNTESDATMEGSMMEYETSSSLEHSDVIMGTVEEPAESSCFGQAPESPEPLQPGGVNSVAAAGGAAGGPESADIVLRDYQMNVARPALEGKNIIICLPTGSGKTRVAVYITKKHLDSRRTQGKSGKVVVLVNKIPLVEQHFSSEFHPFLKHTCKVERVTGDSLLKISFTEIMKKNDVIICTAQILENHLEGFDEGEDEGVHLKDITLIVIDECHHTQKDEVYNHIMMRYLKQKHKNIKLEKLGKTLMSLPQIVGLTASPGVGGATKMKKAEEHILRICANLDASQILTRDLGEHKKEISKITLSVESNKQDPFGDVIKKMMNDIHGYTELSPTCELGSQNYEQWVVQLERQAAKDEDQKVRVCADHLRRYNESVQLSNTIRMCDAFSVLRKYYEEERKNKTTPDDEHMIQTTETERFLFNLFEDNRGVLQKLAQNPEFENDSLSQLRKRILYEFSTRDRARGIIFTKTRRSAIALSQWVQENPKFSDIGVKPAHVIGGGDQSVVKPMTSAEQKDVLKKFRNGSVNLLIATTVAEEGLDIAECNFVIRYGLVTNEIAMVQAQGRGRAEDSSYTLVEVKGSGVTEKEHVNEYRINMMNKAINKIRALKPEDYNKQITEFQLQAILEDKMRLSKMKGKKVKLESPSAFTLSCRQCSTFVCSGEDIQIIEDMHRVNLSPQFSELYLQRENTTLQERHLDYETNGYIACKQCGQRWGSMMIYRSIECPCLLVKYFVVSINGKKSSKYTKWREIPVKFSAFNYINHASQLAEDSVDDDTD